MPNAESPAPASATADLQRLTAALADPAPLNWLITGDSITHGLVHTQGGRSYPEHLHELIRGELARVRDIVINSAISGNRIAD
ncbi:SGNH/GDSL hydrolase family protein, partial [Staphylococcus aureus]|nr:SGNH/GDSL hydrolase family protein [Staphylococcus aureus]